MMGAAIDQEAGQFNKSNGSNSTESDPFNGLYKQVYYFCRYYQIIIIVLGLIGNSITIVIFWRTKLTHSRKTSFYLISLAVNDIAFLITILIKYLDTYGIMKSASEVTIICRLLVYTNFLFNFISCSIVLTFTVQRLCSICFPLRFNSSVLQRRSKYFFFLLILCGILIYTPVLFIFEARENKCTSINEYGQLLQLFSFVDALFTLIIPFLGLVIMNIMIIRTLRNSNYDFINRTSSNRHFSFEPPNHTPNNHQINPNMNNSSTGSQNNNNNTQQNLDTLPLGIDAGLGPVGAANDSATVLYNAPKRNSILKKTFANNVNNNHNRKASFRTSSMYSKNNNSQQENTDYMEQEPLNNSVVKYKSHNGNQKNIPNSFLIGKHNDMLRLGSENSSIYSSSLLPAAATTYNNHVSTTGSTKHQQKQQRRSGGGGGKFEQKRRIMLKTINSSGIVEKTSACSFTQQQEQQQQQNQSSQRNHVVKNESAEFSKRPSSTLSVFEAAGPGSPINHSNTNNYNNASNNNITKNKKDTKRRFSFGRREKKNSEDHFNVNVMEGRRSIRPNEINGGNRSLMNRSSFRHGGRQNRSVSRKVTKMLILVSTIFIVLNFPIHAYTVYIFIRNTLRNSNNYYATNVINATNSTQIEQLESYSKLDSNIFEICFIIFCTSFSCNFLLYSISGVTFRNEFKRLLFKLLRIKYQAKR